MKIKYTIGNVCFLLDPKQENVLLLKRNREPMQGQYTGVGGKIDLSEDALQGCRREVLEESGLIAEPLHLRGVIKTVLKDYDSSWILYVYTGIADKKEFHPCNEGELSWVPIENIKEFPLIGFIREIIDPILSQKSFFEGIIVHNIKGEVLDKKINILAR